MCFAVNFRLNAIKNSKKTQKKLKKRLKRLKCIKNYFLIIIIIF